jgi:hypothetical protein
MESQDNKLEAQRYVHRLSNLVHDIKNERANEKNAEAIVIRKDAERNHDYNVNISNLKEKELKPKFADLIQKDKEGGKALIPNCLMIVSPSDSAANELIKWTGENSKVNFISVNNDVDITEQLEKAEQHYQNKKERTLLHINKFEDLINPNLTQDHHIASLKDLLSCASDEYHTTIIFNTSDPSKLHNIATQSHRLTQIKADFKTPAELAIEDAWDRITTARAETQPIATLNDLLIYQKVKNVDRLKLDHASNELEKVANVLKEKITGDYAKKAFTIALDRLRY